MSDEEPTEGGRRGSRRRPGEADTKTSGQLGDSGKVATIQSEVLEAAKSGDLKTVERLIQIERAWQAPLPPPDVFREYPEAVQNVITENWVDESRHRRKIEVRGQIVGTAIAFGAMAAAVIASLYGHPWVGGSIVASTMLGIGLAGLIRIFPRRR